jgi:hypothetical protein
MRSFCYRKHDNLGNKILKPQFIFDTTPIEKVGKGKLPDIINVFYTFLNSIIQTGTQVLHY